MSKLTDKTLGEACSNGNGSYNALTAMRWLFEATTGKPLSEEEAGKLFEEAKARRAARK